MPLLEAGSKCMRAVPLLLALVAILPVPAVAAAAYAWVPATSSPGVASAGETIEMRFPPPSGFARTAVTPASFAQWLRALPLKPKDAPVVLFNGTPKPRQDVHAAVINIDTGTRDLQQCADAVMRLRAEWQFGSGRQGEIAFNVTSGRPVPFQRYAKGERSDGEGKAWKKSAAPDGSYLSFRKYLDFVFAYAGTASLEAELKPVEVSDVQIGDVFIKGGFPGHAMIVADMVENTITKSKRFLLIQSYMPAQDMHVLKNPANGDGSPWYAPPADNLVTPEWTFAKGSLRRWP